MARRMSRARQEARVNRTDPRCLELALRRDGLDAGRRTRLERAGLELGDRALARRLPAAVAAGVLTPRYSPPPGPGPASESDQLLSLRRSQVSGQRASPRIWTSGSSTIRKR